MVEGGGVIMEVEVLWLFLYYLGWGRFKGGVGGSWWEW